MKMTSSRRIQTSISVDMDVYLKAEEYAKENEIRFLSEVFERGIKLLTKDKKKTKKENQ